jgi:RimJ/RimL family protein N-acetyltransferase
MKPSFQWQTQQMSFPRIEDWHCFAAASGIESSFFLGDDVNQVEQPSTCFVLSEKSEIYAVAQLFTDSRECGLWVTPSRRGHGYGRQAFSSLVASNSTHLYGVVSQSNPHSAAMEYLLKEFGFQNSGKVLGHSIWRFLAKCE